MKRAGAVILCLMTLFVTPLRAYATMNASGWDVTQIALANEGRVLLKRVAQGDLIATLCVKNNSAADAAVLCLAKYEESGRFIGVEYHSISNYSKGTAYWHYWRIDNEAGRIGKLKAFVLSNTRDAIPLGHTAEFPEKGDSHVYARSSFPLIGSRNSGARTGETPLGNLITDSMRCCAQAATLDSIDAAIINGAAIRSDIPVGEITRAQLHAALPFENYLCVIEVTGEQLLVALEGACSELPDAISAFPQVSGIVFEVDTSVEYIRGGWYEGTSWYAPAEPGSRIAIQSVGGRPFARNDTYRIATIDFLADGGDTYRPFLETSEKANCGVLVEDCLAQYLEDVLSGVVPERYKTLQNRIIIT